MSWPVVTRAGSNSGPMPPVCQPGSGDPNSVNGPACLSGPVRQPTISPSTVHTRYSGRPSPVATSESIHACMCSTRRWGERRTSAFQLARSVAVASRISRFMVVCPEGDVLAVETGQRPGRGDAQAAQQEGLLPSLAAGEPAHLVGGMGRFHDEASQHPAMTGGHGTGSGIGREDVGVSRTGGGSENGARHVAAGHRCRRAGLAEEIAEALATVAPFCRHAIRRQVAEDIGVRMRMAADHVALLLQRADAGDVHEARGVEQPRDDEENRAPAVAQQRLADVCGGARPPATPTNPGVWSNPVTMKKGAPQPWRSSVSPMYGALAPPSSNVSM